MLLLILSKELRRVAANAGKIPDTDPVNITTNANNKINPDWNNCFEYNGLSIIWLNQGRGNSAISKERTKAKRLINILPIRNDTIRFVRLAPKMLLIASSFCCLNEPANDRLM